MKVCCLCGREGHSANACPWAGFRAVSEVSAQLHSVTSVTGT